MQSMVNTKEIIEQNEFYINKIIQDKYCLDGEKSWNDIVNRFEEKLTKDSNLGKISKESVINIISLMRSKKFIPGGSILQNFNNKNKHSSLSNCYYLDIQKDSVESIFDTLNNNAKTFSWRGGMGNSLEILRPQGSLVNNSAKNSTGSVSFMPLFAQATNTIAQKGRRGALMLSHNIYHPDIEDFIISKTEAGKTKLFGSNVNLSSCNISIKISDAFMKAVENDENWKLVFPDIESDKEKYETHWNGDIDEWKNIGGKVKEYKKVKARKLLRSIAESCYTCGDPGVLYWDTIKSNTPTTFNPRIAPRGVNPCLTGDSKVAVIEDGNFKEKEIKDIKVGDKVLSFDESKNNSKLFMVDEVIFSGKTKENAEILELKLTNGHKLKLTPDHKVYYKISGTFPVYYDEIQNVFKKSESEDILIYTFEGFSCIDSVTPIPKEDVFDITTKKYHNFYANGILVHNCGEQILNNAGNCLLAASVLTKYVENPYTTEAYFNYNEYLKDIESIFEFMDYLIDENTHPLQIQKDTDLYGRKIGYELTGLADAFASLGYSYGSSLFLEKLEDFMKIKLMKEFEVQVKLAKKKGTATAVQDMKSEYTKQPYIKRVLEMIKDEKLIKDFNEYGVRNTAWSTFGPTGSISIVAENVTSGIEPLFALRYNRKSTIFNNEEYTLIHYPLFKYLNENTPEDILLSDDILKEKYHYKEATEIPIQNRIQTQSIIQKYTTDAISSTINLPNSATIDDIYKLYIMGWKSKLKGITIFRSGCEIEGVLTSVDKSSENKLTKKPIPIKSASQRHIEFNKDNEKVYISVVYDEKSKKPFEIFANLPPNYQPLKDEKYSKDVFLENYSHWSVTTRLISLALRFGLPLEEIIEQLDKSSFSSFNLSNLISNVLKKYLITGNYEVCPSCGEKSLKRENGCDSCLSCGYSKCSL